MIFVNFKTYRQASGPAAVSLAKICAAVACQTSVKIIPLVQAADLFSVAQAVEIPVWAQHVDNIEPGANTGQTLAETIKLAGAQGTLLNHSENKLPVAVSGEIIKRCRQLGLATLVCSESLVEAQQLVNFKPDFLAYEPPELIGTTISVATARPAVVKDFINARLEVPVIIGAGIQTNKDIKKGLKLGAAGFLVASSVVLAKSPRAALLALTKGFKS